MENYPASVFTRFTTRTYKAVMEAEEGTKSCQSQLILTIC